MHLFALNEELLDQITGGDFSPGAVFANPRIPIAPLPEKPITHTIMAIGEDGGCWYPQLL